MPMNEYGEIIRNSSPPPPIPPLRNNNNNNNGGCIIGIIIGAIITVVIITAIIIMVAINSPKNHDITSTPESSQSSTQDFVNNDDQYHYSNTSDNDYSSESEEIIITEDPIHSIGEYSPFKKVIKNTYSSSQLNDENVNGTIHSYSAQKTLDGDLSTCWCEGSSGDGIGDYIVFEFDNDYYINEITLWNGLCTNEELYYKNSRIKTMTIEFSDGSSTEYKCGSDWTDRVNEIRLQSPVKTSYIKIIINSVHSGNKYTDTCISEVSLS